MGSTYGDHRINSGGRGGKRVATALSAHLVETYIRCNPAGAAKLPYKLFKQAALPAPTAAQTASQPLIPPPPIQSTEHSQHQTGSAAHIAPPTQPPPPLTQSLSASKPSSPVGTPPSATTLNSPPVIPVTLTQPSDPEANNGHDNKNSDLILRTTDIIGSAVETGEPARCCLQKNSSYTITSMLGQGTFGQVIKCRVNPSSSPPSTSGPPNASAPYPGQYVAIKVLKNKPAYFRQGMLEVGILALLNFQYDHDGTHKTVRMVDYFLVHNHLCIVFELLSINLFELVKQNNYKGLSPRLIRHFVEQVLDSLEVMERAHIIHCDLKPENVLMEAQGATRVKLIDFGSACFGNSPLYTYIQSRHYRAPEVLLGLPYTTAIDMWSLGCITAELLIGIPLFPGANEYNQIFKITDMLGPFPTDMLEKGTHTSKFYKRVYSPEQHAVKFVLKSIPEYQLETKLKVDPDKRYFAYRTLVELIQKTPIRPALPEDQARETRRSMEHFLRGLLQLDPSRRWTPSQARAHPFITDVRLTEDWIPPPALPKPKLMDNFYTTIVSMMKTASSQNFVSATYFLQFMQHLTKHLSILNSHTSHVTPAFYQPSLPPQSRTDLSPIRRRAVSESVKPNPQVTGGQSASPQQQPPQPQPQIQMQAAQQPSAPTTPQQSTPPRLQTNTSHYASVPTIPIGPPPPQILSAAKVGESRRASWAPLPNFTTAPSQPPSSPLASSKNRAANSHLMTPKDKSTQPPFPTTASPISTSHRTHLSPRLAASQPGTGMLTPPTSPRNSSSHSPSNTPTKRTTEDQESDLLGTTPTSHKGPYFPPNGSWTAQISLHNPNLMSHHYTSHHSEADANFQPNASASSGLTLQLKGQPTDHHSRPHHTSYHGSHHRPTSLSPTSPPLLPSISSGHTTTTSLDYIPSSSTTTSATHIYPLAPSLGAIPMGSSTSASTTTSSTTTSFPVLGSSVSEKPMMYIPQLSLSTANHTAHSSPATSPTGSPRGSSHHHHHHRKHGSGSASPPQLLLGHSPVSPSSSSSSSSTSTSPRNRGGSSAAANTVITRGASPATTVITGASSATMAAVSLNLGISGGNNSASAAGVPAGSFSHSSRLHDFLKKFKL
ncbi:protein serine/threonine kinase [Pelomyxa schiedti]|nr:protein serine/threonine kinase [Pelomyxa schiedti]